MVIAEFPFTIWFNHLMILHLWLPYLDFGFYPCDFHILTLDFTLALPISWHWILPLWSPCIDLGLDHDGFSLSMMVDGTLPTFTIYADIALCTSHWWIVTLWSHFTHLVIDTCSWDCSRLILLAIATLQHDDVSLPSFLRMILHITLIIDLTLWLSCWSECAFNALLSTHVTCVLYLHDAVTIHSLHISDCAGHLMS